MEIVAIKIAAVVGQLCRWFSKQRGRRRWIRTEWLDLHSTTWYEDDGSGGGGDYDVVDDDDGGGDDDYVDDDRFI